jgi:nicotinamide-nucleotide amidase
MNDVLSISERDTPALVALAADLLQKKGWMLATAESCTGGLIAGACTDLSGSSAWFERGIVSYSNAAKVELLGVPEQLIAAHGAVSEEVVRAMAEGAIARSRAQVAVAVTGVAGPTGGSPEKPVGLVWFGWSIGGVLSSEQRLFPGDRAAIRAATVHHALQTLVRQLAADKV